MLRYSTYLPFVAAMALVVVASNVLVQFPVQGYAGQIALADILTWGAFTYPFAFLVTDLANRWGVAPRADGRPGKRVWFEITRGVRRGSCP